MSMRKSVVERQQALETRHPAWVARTLDQALDEVARTWPDREFIVTDHVSFSYREVDQWATRLAYGLQHAGIRPGDHVALIMANYPEFVALKFAISRVGATAVPINFLNRRDELAYVLEQSDARCLVTMDSSAILIISRCLTSWRPAGSGRAVAPGFLISSASLYSRLPIVPCVRGPPAGGTR